MQPRLAGKVAIVTGAGRAGNIGVGICDSFLAEGARAVIATDFRSDHGETLRSEMEHKYGSGRFLFARHDVTDDEDWRRVVRVAVDSFGGVDVLVNNAGISVHGGVENTTLDELRRVMAVNHDGLFLGMKHCAATLTAAGDRFPGGGSIINNLSMASYMSSAHNLGYHVSKAAGRMLTVCAAAEFGSRGIRVNSVHPGVTITPLLEEGFDQYVRQGLWTDATAARKSVVAQSPLAVEAFPNDLAHAFVYLASDESRFVTGASLTHDGGLGSRY